MPGSEYYEREPTEAEKATAELYRLKDIERWERCLTQARSVGFCGHTRLERMLMEVQDYIKARLYDLR
jgi:hypothetical protein